MRYIRNMLNRFGSTLRSPSVVLEIIGKIATITAQMVRAHVVSFTQMMINGAMATIGVTCISTA